MLAKRRWATMILATASWTAVSWTALPALGEEVATAAQAYGEKNPVVAAGPNGTIFCEAEEFQIRAPGWKAQDWGANYYCATLANTFLSRKCFLGAPAQCDQTVAEREVQVPRAARYLVLVRYEAPYRFEARFSLEVQQNGKTLLSRRYGARENPKIWAFGRGVQPEVAWPWGAVENLVWEGHATTVDLKPGKATLRLIAGKQPEPAARRNVDLVMLTTDKKQVEARIATENYLPLDGMLTQASDVYLRVKNDGRAAVSLAIPNGIEHSPYWVHQRGWKPINVAVEAGKTSGWTEVGSLLDTLNDGQWKLKATSKGPLNYAVELAAKDAGGMTPMGAFESRESEMVLAYDANTRYTRRIRSRADALAALVEAIGQQPERGRWPQRMPVYAIPPKPHPEDPRYTAAREAFLKMFPARVAQPDLVEVLRGDGDYLDVLGLGDKELESVLQRLKREGLASKIAVASLGDEIALSLPPSGDHEGFRRWLERQRIQPSDVEPSAGDDWRKVNYSPDPSVAESKPRLFYYSNRYAHQYGIAALRARTELVRRYLPNAGVGANFSPHQGCPYLGKTHKWIDVFRQGGMTMPWSEDYVFQSPVGTQQMSFIDLDLFRAALKGKPQEKIFYYVMPHWPGNNPDSWRRQFYGALAHGMKMVNVYELYPLQTAYSENYVDSPEMYRAVRRGLHELGLFDDVIEDGRVGGGLAALWFSETGDIWEDNAAPFGAAKRALYVAIRHWQLPLDFVTEADAAAGDLKDYRVLYLSDRHVSSAASQAIAEWVESGGRLWVSAGGGLLNEFNRPNAAFQRLLGITPKALEIPKSQTVSFIKQDLPLLAPLDVVSWSDGKQARKIPIFGAKASFQLRDAQMLGTFGDGKPAVSVRPVGKGQVVYCGFLPGLSYFAPAVPRRPLDRNSGSQTMTHFIPTAFDAGAAAVVGTPAMDIPRPVVCSEPLVETTIVASPQGTVIPLVNWSEGPVSELRVTVHLQTPAGRAELASGNPLSASTEEGARVFTLRLDVADALILRP